MVALRVGLTGGIGSGKSTVAAMLAAHGATLVDTDRIARELAAPGGAAVDAIRAAFGADFIGPDGGLDRTRMRDAVFSAARGDAAPAKQRLEAILHPLIGIEAERQAASAAGPVVVFDIPLLVESGRWRGRLDRVWLVDCAEDVQVSRVVARSGWTHEAVRAVIAGQASRLARRAAADAVIHNEGIALDALAREVASLWQLATSAGPASAGGRSETL